MVKLLPVSFCHQYANFMKRSCLDIKALSRQISSSVPVNLPCLSQFLPICPPTTCVSFHTSADPAGAAVRLWTAGFARLRSRPGDHQQPRLPPERLIDRHGVGDGEARRLPRGERSSCGQTTKSFSRLFRGPFRKAGFQKSVFEANSEFSVRQTRVFGFGDIKKS